MRDVEILKSRKNIKPDNLTFLTYFSFIHFIFLSAMLLQNLISLHQRVKVRGIRYTYIDGEENI